MSFDYAKTLIVQCAWPDNNLQSPDNPRRSIQHNFMGVYIPRRLINQILEQAQNSPTREICGLISSKDKHPVRCYPISNKASDPEHHFLLNPREQIDAMREMRERNEYLFAIYHSHPDAPAIPSVEDIQWSAYPDVLYLIISMGITGTIQINGFLIQGSSAEPIETSLL